MPGSRTGGAGVPFSCLCSPAADRRGAGRGPFRATVSWHASDGPGPTGRRLVGQEHLRSSPFSPRRVCFSMHSGRPLCALRPLRWPADRSSLVGQPCPFFILEVYHGTVLVESLVEEKAPSGFPVG